MMDSEGGLTLTVETLNGAESDLPAAEASSQDALLGVKDQERKVVPLYRPIIELKSIYPCFVVKFAFFVFT